MEFTLQNTTVLSVCAQCNPLNGIKIFYLHTPPNHVTSCIYSLPNVLVTVLKFKDKKSISAVINVIMNRAFSQALFIFLGDKTTITVIVD